MMKKYLLFVVMVMSVGVVRGQYSNTWLRMADSCIKVGNCYCAEGFYDVYQEMEYETDDGIERRIGECWIRKADSCLMYGKCDEAFDYYNFYRTMVVRNDKKMENRIAECMRGVAQSTPGQSFSVNSLPFNMIHVNGGSFEMGGDGEGPVHKVTLSDYYIGETEVTQALWTAVMGSNPSVFKGDSLPVENVSYNDVLIFIQKLNEMTGKVFRLPTEAEWEYAARGGQKSKGYMYSGSNEIVHVAWCCNNSGDYYIQGYGRPYALKLKEKSNCRTNNVKSIFKANELGIYDMSGNVWEWCSDASYKYGEAEETNPQHEGDSLCGRVCRGGSWDDWYFFCRSTSRRDCPPDYADNRIGFRLAMTPVKKKRTVKTTTTTIISGSNK